MQGEASDGFTVCLTDLPGHCGEGRRRGQAENVLQDSSRAAVGALEVESHGQTVKGVESGIGGIW